MFHIHRYHLTEDWTQYKWDGLTFYKRVKRCRCGAGKMKIRGVQ